MTSPRLLLAILIVLGAASPRLSSADGVEDAAARARLPEFKVIPAARPDELTPAEPLSLAPFRSWTHSQGDDGGRRYSTLAQINRDNVKALRPAWVYHSRDGAAHIECTPIVVDGILYGPTAGRAIVAVDAATGRERWRYQVESPEVPGIADSPARRGLVYWPGDKENAPRILFGSGNWIYAIDPLTGRLLAGFGENGRTPIETGSTTSSVVYRHVFVTDGVFGDVYGYDVRDGRPLWRFHTRPRGDEFGASTWVGEEPHVGADTWSGLSVDQGRGIVYTSVGNPRPEMVGDQRLGDDLFSDCVLALDALTGKRLWHFQTTHHDIWDQDVVGVPNLVTVQRDGRRVDAVTGFTKNGLVLLLDRMTGKPLFPFRLRRAPVSRLPGERTAPYQPDPELPEPVSRMEFDPADITNRTPAAHAYVLSQVRRSEYGFFPSHTEGVPTLYIGSRGGAEWGGAAVDVKRGRLYLTSNRLVSMITVIPNDERDRDPKYPPTQGENHFMHYCAPCHGANRSGTAMAPSLVSLKTRMSDAAVLELLDKGRGNMPANHLLDAAQKRALLDFLFRRNQPPPLPANPNQGGPAKYVFTGFRFLNDNEGYPGINPPWGLINCYDLNTGRILWRKPLGEIESLTRQGLPVTGSQNLGGATVTSGGLVFVAGTQDEKIRAFDADSGAELWSAKLPFAGTAAPAVYEVAGREYVVVTATGGGYVGGAAGQGDAYVAFALPP